MGFWLVRWEFCLRIGAGRCCLCFYRRACSAGWISRWMAAFYSTRWDSRWWLRCCSDLCQSLEGFESVTRIYAALKDRTGNPTGSARWYGLRGVLVMLQVALSLVALAGAGLFIHSLRNAQEMDPGFEVKHEMVMFVGTSALNTGTLHAAPGESSS